MTEISAFRAICHIGGKSNVAKGAVRAGIRRSIQCDARRGALRCRQSKDVISSSASPGEGIRYDYPARGERDRRRTSQCQISKCGGLNTNHGPRVCGRRKTDSAISLVGCLKSRAARRPRRNNVCRAAAVIERRRRIEIIVEG